jgi:glucan phosphoethanolaminetransferase (alkaline phosphatase superfamily)
LAIVVAAVTRSWRRFFLVQLPFSILGVGFVIYTLTFNMPPGRTLAHILVGASVEELRGFLQLRPGLVLLAVLTLWSLLYLGLCFVVPPQWNFGGRTRAVSRPLVLMLLPLTAYATLDPAQMIDGAALDPVVGSLIFLGGQIPAARDELGGSRVSKRPYGANRAGSEEVHILVVGESARKASWSSYGHSRPTTPMLDSLGGEIIWLRNAVADANLTDWAVPIMLTGMSPVGFDMAKVRGTIFDLAREAGYHTAWLVNQDLAISESVGVTADDLICPPDLEANINGRHTLDEVLLPGYGKELSLGASPRFIGIHMMGSHWEYYRRYSPAFQRYGASAAMTKLSMVSVLVGSAESQSALVDAYV